ncbi:MAG: flagellar basal body P-ring protein FlgI [Alphaproteobacteria bacterium]|jgi:flagellar P-ring protein precursor FlgI|nr:flagellar basal body P-ring protein FlgI [Alphaproteobacteria bacterium]
MVRYGKGGDPAGIGRRPARHRLAALALALLAVLPLAFGPGPARGEARIKDIVDIEGVRENLLVGYGLVVGLNGTGDGLNGSPFTEQSLIGMLERLGVNIRAENLDTDNVAAVMVTATLPAFSRQGSRIDVTVASLGDAESLLGGQLLVTPLLGADGEVYAVAQGALSVGGFAVAGDAQSVTQGVPTTGRIPNGAIVERELPFEFGELGNIQLSLHNPDFTTARRIMEAINARFGRQLARATDPSTVQIDVPADRANDVVGLVTEIEQLRIVPDQVARVVVDERTGVIVMGENVRVSTVAIAQGNLTVRITETPQVSQPNPFSEGGTTEVVPRTQIEIDQGEDNRLGVVEESVSLQDLVQALNALGVGPRDMISILQAIEAAGALQATIDVM